MVSARPHCAGIAWTRELVRTMATARITMPASMVRLSAGRLSLSDEAQALCFLAGANSIFMGERLLTTPNPGVDRDRALFDKLGMTLVSVGTSPQVGGVIPSLITAQSAVDSLMTAPLTRPSATLSRRARDARRRVA